MRKDKIIVGAIETCALPELGINEINVRVDTGAKTSSLHVDNIVKFTKGKKPWVQFDIHPNVHNVEQTTRCEAPLFDIRRIKSSNGDIEERYIIRTIFQLDVHEWAIDISLTNRADMSFMMLLGREGMGHRVLVDPAARFVAS